MHHEPHKLVEKSREDSGRTLDVVHTHEELLVNPEIVFERIQRLVEALKKLPHPLFCDSALKRERNVEC